MIPVLGIVICLYVITRMAETYEIREGRTGLRVFATITAIVALLALFYFLMIGLNGPETPTYP